MTPSDSLGQKVAQLIVAEESPSATAQTAISVSRAILEGNWAKLDTLLDSNFTYTGDGYVFTKDEYIGFMQDMRAAFSDFDMTLEKIVTEGNFVSIRFSSKVVNTGKFMGAPANQKNLVVTGIFQRKVENGKVMQEWQTTDLLGVMSQIGFGATLGYAIFATGFKVEQPRPARKPNDFLQVDGKVENFDKLSPKEKNRYVKNYSKK
ncbi:MAG: ester cyclase [Chitinophagales bacterium]|jgi:predicted ester cyclase|nr:ester cyclase [Chitinophagales bacterium]HNI43317.1 ester cyclase [Chitinophagales bacterium]HNL06051.1 ester cyclase [Chitinophagales bacterium]